MPPWSPIPATAAALIPRRRRLSSERGIVLLNIFLDDASRICYTPLTVLRERVRGAPEHFTGRAGGAAAGSRRP
jgi:hypothetical protein